MLYRWLLDKNGHRCEPLTDLSYPVVLLQRGESRGDRFIESLRSDLYGVLNVSKILYRNCARSENHGQKRSIFAFCSPVGPDRDHSPELIEGAGIRCLTTLLCPFRRNPIAYALLSDGDKDRRSVVISVVFDGTDPPFVLVNINPEVEDTAVLLD